MAAFVIDASATLPWCFADEATEATNALLIAVRRTRIPPEDVHQFLEDLDVLPIRVDSTTKNIVRASVFPLAKQYELTVYDAAYLELAIRQNLPPSHAGR